MGIRECLYCDFPMECDMVDIGVGFQQCGPYHCDNCGASEIHPDDDKSELTQEEIRTNFYKVGKVSSKANVDANGKLISHKQADYLYRKKCFKEHGNPYNARLDRL